MSDKRVLPGWFEHETGKKLYWTGEDFIKPADPESLTAENVIDTWWALQNSIQLNEMGKAINTYIKCAFCKMPKRSQRLLERTYVATLICLFFGAMLLTIAGAIA